MDGSAATMGLTAGCWYAEQMAEEPRRTRCQSTAGGALPVSAAVRGRGRVETRSEGGFADGGAEIPSEAEADTVGPVVAAEFASCVELLDKEVGCATVVAAARVSAGPVPRTVGKAKAEAK